MPHHRRSTRALAAIALLFAAGSLAPAQPTSTSPLAPRPNGPKNAEPTRHAIVGVTVHVNPTTTIENAAVVFEAGRITAVTPSKDADLTAAVVHNAEGMHLYPAFIDPWLEVDAPAPNDADPAAHWNDAVTPQRSALAGPGVPGGTAEAHRKLGFAAAAIVPKGGIFAGQAAAVSLAKAPADDSAAFERIYAPAVYHALDFQPSRGDRGYPDSHIGVVALIRQTLIDADWQAAHDPAAQNALTTLGAPAPSLPLVFDCDIDLETLLAHDIAREFNRPAIVLGSGTEFRRLAAVQQIDRPFILPLRYPDKPDVSSVAKAERTELDTMMQWEQAPTNPRRLIDAGRTIALTPHKLPKKQSFHDNLRKAIEQGLTEEQALAALTTTPATLLNLAGQLGTIEQGKRANLLLTTGPVFDKKTKFIDLFIDGLPHHLTDRPTDLDGSWALLADESMELELDIDGTDVALTIPGLDDPIKAKAKLTNNRVDFAVNVERGGGLYLVSGLITQTPEGTQLIGSTLTPDGRVSQWTATRLPPAADNDNANNNAEAEANADDKDDDKKDDEKPADKAPDIAGAPFGPYAYPELPPQQAFVFTNATIWTSAEDGIIDKGAIVIVDGKIGFVGAMDILERAKLKLPENTQTIDLEGKHITPGLIDAHSHTALNLGINEAGQAVTAEVRIADSWDPADIGIYRELATGLTTVLSLHGSANPIGGQSQVHKLRWGAPLPADFRVEDAKTGIKFALGENVKQSNWGDNNTTRYPQTRMGVETLIRDRFQAAREYMSQWTDLARYMEQTGVDLGDPQKGEFGNYPIPESTDQQEFLREAYAAYVEAARKNGKPVSEKAPRKDLELEALAQILANERLVHCHSYRQDEILMLCRVAEDFRFKIGTLQHGLEVYKVAEAVKQHALGASIFSDWWAYKVEVMDAIPFAGPLQTEAGVLTSFNSDSDELARRMNTEAAKAIKYARRDDNGNPVISPAEALKFVTINPAIQIGADHRIGSLEPGKDADIVIWSAQPLSMYAKAERVFIDGREHYSIDRDRELRATIQRERQRLITKLLDEAKKDPKKDAGPKPADKPADEAKPATETTDTPPTRAHLLARMLTTDPLAQPTDTRGVCGCTQSHYLNYYHTLTD